MSRLHLCILSLLLVFGFLNMGSNRNDNNAIRPPKIQQESIKPPKPLNQTQVISN